MVHILGPGHVEAAHMTAAAQPQSVGHLIYPAEPPAQPGLFDR